MSENLETGQPPAPDNADDNVVHFPQPEPAAAEQVAAEDQDENDETPDDLDAAAALVRQDYDRRTVAFPDPVEGAALADELVTTINTFMAAMPDGSAEMLALWVMHSYAAYPCGLRFSPRLMIRKPVSNSGGTNLTTLLLHLVRRPKYNSGISDATFFRQANQKRTVIIDECDNAMMRSNAKLVRMLNAGHGITGCESRTEKVGGKWVPVSYPIFAPTILCGIGDFAPVTVRNRSFIVSLKRKMPDEQADEFNPTDHGPALRTLREKIIRWIGDNIPAIRDCRPELDRSLHQNRQRENISTLLMIADTIGAEWGRRARKALTDLTARDKPVDENELLIGDIAEILLDPAQMVGDPPRKIGHDNCVFSTDLTALLKERFTDRMLYESGWNASRLAEMLRTFEITPQRNGKRRGSGSPLRWYRRDDFDDAIARYAGDIAAMFAESAAQPATPLPETSKCSGVADDASPSQDDTREVEQPQLPLHEAFPNANNIPPGKGDKKRAKKLRAGVEALIRQGRYSADEVVFTSGLFWLIETSTGGHLCWAHVDNSGHFSIHEIDDAGLLADKAKSTIVLNRTASIRLPPHDFVRYRALANKADICKQ